MTIKPDKITAFFQVPMHGCAYSISDSVAGKVPAISLPVLELPTQGLVTTND